MLLGLLFVWSSHKLQNHAAFFSRTYFLHILVFLQVNNAGQMPGIAHMIQGTTQNLSPFGISQVLVFHECCGTRFQLFQLYPYTRWFTLSQIGALSLMQVQPMTQQVVWLLIRLWCYVHSKAYMSLWQFLFSCSKRLQGMLGECMLAGFLLLLTSRFSIWTPHPYKI